MIKVSVYLSAFGIHQNRFLDSLEHAGKTIEEFVQIPDTEKFSILRSDKELLKMFSTNYSAIQEQTRIQQEQTRIQQELLRRKQKVFKWLSDYIYPGNMETLISYLMLHEKEDYRGLIMEFNNSVPEAERAAIEALKKKLQVGPNRTPEKIKFKLLGNFMAIDSTLNEFFPFKKIYIRSIYKEIYERVQQNSKIVHVIIGDPGIGKTTCARYLSCVILKRANQYLWLLKGVVGYTLMVKIIK
jgi:ATPase subunit of ABC transporter with duplicated ATPase domains